MSRPILIALALLFLPVALNAEAPKVADHDEYAWQSLFDGKSLDGWKIPQYGGDGEVTVKDGCLVIGMGAMITGIKYDKVFPLVDYEIRYEAKRTQGSDFFAALTFPYKDNCCTFINGGWGGGTTGLSCVDGLDASENETSTFFSYSDQKWYKFRIRVAGTFIRVWVDEETKDGTRKETQVIDLETEDKTISLRDETSAFQPLGICTWVGEGVLRNLEYRKLRPEEVDGKVSTTEAPPTEAATGTPGSDLAGKPWLVESARLPEGLPKPSNPQMLWADSVRFQKIADVLGGPIEVERWVNAPPKDPAGKFVLVEVWATWCPPCRRNLPLLEYFHEKYKDQLVVVSICETDEKALEKMQGPLKAADLKAPLAVDTHRRFANALGVYGIPHAVLIDPILGAVVWEGMPTQIGYELSDDVMAKILANLKNPAVQAKLPKESPVVFKTCPPDPNRPNEMPRVRTRSYGDEEDAAPQ